MLFKKPCLFVISICLIMLANLVEANIGKVLLAIGEVQIERDAIISANRGMELLEGDIVLTGSNGRAQLLMLDGARIALKPDSKIALDEYKYSPPSEDVIGTSESSMTLSVIKGGFRTITGAIGKGDDKSGYKVKTPVATIGIRGTDYELNFTPAGSNNNEQGSLAVGVWSGSIRVSNSAGDLDLGDLGNFRFAVVSGENQPPKGQNAPPVGIGDSITPFDPTQSTSGEGTLDATTPIPIDLPTIDIVDTVQSDDNPITGENQDDILPIEGNSGGDNHGFDTGEIPESSFESYSITSSSGFLDGFNVSTNSSINNTIFDFESGILSTFQTNDPQVTFAANGVENLNIGFDPDSGIAWGRWAEGFVNAVDANGQSQTFDLSSQSLHWLMDTNSNENASSLPVTGSASYQLVGNTDPTNNFGDTGILGNASLSVNFSTNTVTNDLSLAMNDNVWQASGSGLITAGTSLFDGIYDQVSINGVAGGSGQFNGFFSSLFDSESGLPAGAGLTFTLSDNGSVQEIINGGLIFGKPVAAP